MNNKKTHPVSRCTVCEKTSTSIGTANTKCYEKFGNKTCKGTMKSSVSIGDWEECPLCSATGRTDSGSCVRCNGAGHLYVRDIS